jgi:transketolase C-terminal domain/subunit
MKEEDFLVHADVFNTKKFPTKAKVINAGLGETNAINIASCLSYHSKGTVYIYGVAGFIIHKYEALKLSLKNFGSKYGKIIIFNAGKIGYENLGKGHILDDDEDLMNILKIPFYAPKDLEELETILLEIDNEKNGIFYIQLGKDYGNR